MLLVLQGVHRLPPTEDYFTLVSLLLYVVKPYQCLIPRLRNQITEPESKLLTCIETLLSLSSIYNLSPYCLPNTVEPPLTETHQLVLCISVVSTQISRTPSHATYSFPSLLFFQTQEVGYRGRRPCREGTVPPSWPAAPPPSRDDTATARWTPRRAEGKAPSLIDHPTLSRPTFGFKSCMPLTSRLFTVTLVLLLITTF